MPFCLECNPTCNNVKTRHYNSIRDFCDELAVKVESMQFIIVMGTIKWITSDLNMVLTVEMTRKIMFVIMMLAKHKQNVIWPKFI